jgi:hypothetical protein
LKYPPVSNAVSNEVRAMIASSVNIGDGHKSKVPQKAFDISGKCRPV